jgi:hypothetical protein
MRKRWITYGILILATGIGLGAWLVSTQLNLLSDHRRQTVVTKPKQQAAQPTPVEASQESAGVPFGPGYRLMVINQSSKMIDSAEIAVKAEFGDVPVAAAGWAGLVSDYTNRAGETYAVNGQIGIHENGTAVFERSERMYRNFRKETLWQGRCKFDIVLHSGLSGSWQIVFPDQNLCLPASVVVTDDLWVDIAAKIPDAVLIRAKELNAEEPDLPMAADPTKFFRRLFYAPMNGKVGFHMVSKLLLYHDDEPGRGAGVGQYGCTGKWTHSALTVDGTLPSGITLEGSNFEGTPQEPGDWEVTVHVPHVHCFEGFDTDDYGDRDIHVHFHIDGDPARDVDQLP